MGRTKRPDFSGRVCSGTAVSVLLIAIRARAACLATVSYGFVRLTSGRMGLGCRFPEITHSRRYRSEREPVGWSITASPGHSGQRKSST